MSVENQNKIIVPLDIKKGMQGLIEIAEQEDCRDIEKEEMFFSNLKILQEDLIRAKEQSSLPPLSS